MSICWNILNRCDLDLSILNSNVKKLMYLNLIKEEDENLLDRIFMACFKVYVFNLDTDI